MTQTLQNAIKVLEEQAESAWKSEDYDRGEAIDSAVFEIGRENEKRIEKAQLKLADFSEEHKDSGMINANDTFAHYGSDALYMCEFWECAVDSAQSMADSENY